MKYYMGPTELRSLRETIEHGYSLLVGAYNEWPCEANGVYAATLFDDIHWLEAMLPPSPMGVIAGIKQVGINLRS
jgi:hypothetical protein